MRLILLGPPGAGKGTFAKIYARRLKLPHISTGDLLRSHIQQKTELGKKAAALVEKGQLVPDTLVIEIVRAGLRETDARSGFILDGFPRTEAQAIALDEMLQQEHLRIDHVLNFDSTDAKIIWRLSGRRTCSKCGEIYHVTNIPPKVTGICDRCSGELVQRKDDNEETVRKRLEVYRKETLPLIRYYEKKELLRHLNGDLEVSDLEPILEQLLV